MSLAGISIRADAERLNSFFEDLDELEQFRLQLKWFRYGKCLRIQKRRETKNSMTDKIKEETQTNSTESHALPLWEFLKTPRSPTIRFFAGMDAEEGFVSSCRIRHEGKVRVLFLLFCRIYTVCELCISGSELGLHFRNGSATTSA